MMKEDPSFGRDPTDVSKMRQRLSETGVAVVDTEVDYDKIVETGEPELDTLAREIRKTVKVDALRTISYGPARAALDQRCAPTLQLVTRVIGKVSL
jgi:hypothetical protein